MSMVMGQRIHDKREENGLTREELAETLGVSRQTIYKWEEGKVKNIDRDYISRMAKMWNCDPDWLMHMEGKKKVTATYEAPGRDSGAFFVQLLCNYATQLQLKNGQKRTKSSRYKQIKKWL